MTDSGLMARETIPTPPSSSLHRAVVVEIGLTAFVVFLVPHY
jgi:hypothetical protein